MKTIILAIFICLVLDLSAQKKTTSAYKGTKGKLHIYLLIGQSNMAGRAPFTKEESAPVTRAYLFNGKSLWEDATNPLNRYSTIRKGLGMQKMNPGYTFAQVMTAKDKAISVGLIVNAKGGSKISQWTKQSKFYKDALRRVEEARKTGVLKGILWHQGESDAKNEDYLEKLKTLVKNFRTDLNLPKLPFVAGQVNNVKLINDQIAQLPSQVKYTAFTSSDGLKAMDRWHFDAKSMKLLGRRYAEEMLKLQDAVKR